MNHFEKIRAAIIDRGLDAMLLTEQANRFYAAGFHSTGTDALVLVTKKGNYYFTDARYIEAAEKNVQDAAIALASRERSYSDLVNEVITMENIVRVGFDDTHMTVSDHVRYKEKLHCALVSASATMAQLRIVKDEEEIAAMVAAQRIAEKALQDVLCEIRVGITEKEIAALLVYRMLRHGAENVSFDPIVASGPNGSVPHAVPTDRKICAGEFVTMDFGCIYRGYCSDMTRTIAIGKVSEEMHRVYDTVLRAQKAGIAATRAGVSCRSVDAAARDVVTMAGYGAYFTHSYGHGVGIEIHEAPSVSEASEKILPAGAVTSAEPGIYIPGHFGVRIEDVVVVREDGCEVITTAPKELLTVRA
ncbi:MAG: aminopeptidase P family protein [Oscillospiraceae bacterium]|nr:aminopeptidase P family protein [Oscillospiraceae bacterium]